MYSNSSLVIVPLSRSSFALWTSGRSWASLGKTALKKTYDTHQVTPIFISMLTKAGFVGH